MKNEHVDNTKKIKRATDSFLHIGDKKYHIECQKLKDKTMALRMFEYDVLIAIQESRESQDDRDCSNVINVTFPQSCVVFLSVDNTIEDKIAVNVNFADGFSHTYYTPVFKAQSCTKEQLFLEHLFILLPYYILRYERKVKSLNTDVKKQEALITEYHWILERLSYWLQERDYFDLVEEMRKVSDHVFRNADKVRERVDDLMVGGARLLYTESIERDARQEQLMELIKKKLDKGKSLERIADELEESVENIKPLYNRILETVNT